MNKIIMANGNIKASEIGLSCMRISNNCIYYFKSKTNLNLSCELSSNVFNI